MWVNAYLDKSQITVVIVTYNSAHCVESWATWLCPTLDVIVVDNNSHDETVHNIKKNFPHVRVIELAENVGFGRANNLALELVASKYALLLNPDCHLQERDLDRLAQAASECPDAAIIVPQQVNTNGVLQLNYGPKFGTWRAKTGPVDGPACVGHAGAAVWLLQMDLMKQVGFFDPAFFLYYEDTDLALRVVNAGLQIVVVPQPRIIHVSRGSVGGKNRLRSEYWRGFHHAQSKITFTRKHQSLESASSLLNKTYHRALLLCLVRVLFFSPKYLARACGRLMGLTKLYKEFRD